MRILQINSVYKIGSTGAIVHSIGEVLRRKGHDVFTCYGLGLDSYDDYSRKICSNTEHLLNALWARVSGIPYGGLFVSNLRFRRIIKRYHPDVVHLHCVNCFTINVYHLLKYLARNGIKTIVTCHSEFFHTGSCGHSYDCRKWEVGCHKCKVYRRETVSWIFDRSSTAWRRMNKAFKGFLINNIVITAVSPWLSDRARRSAILGRFEVVSVLNGVDTQTFRYIPNTHLIDSSSYQKVVLFVTPFFTLAGQDLKGGRFIPLIAKMNPDFLFVVVASRQETVIDSLPNNVLLWGRAKSQDELARLYSEADVTLVLSRRETFSMVTAESLCCGTPVVGFNAGGPESIALKEYSSFVEYGNIHLLSQKMRQALFMENNKSDISTKASDMYNKEKMSNGYLTEYKRLIAPLC